MEDNLETTYRTPEFTGKVEKFEHEVSPEYFEKVQQAVESEIGWIVGEVPQFPQENIKHQEEQGGSYVDGVISMNDKNFNIHYPHEYLHWISRHRDRSTDVGFGMKSEHTTRGIKTLGSLVQGEPTSLSWLSEAIVSETTQHVLWKTGEVREPSSSYQDSLSSPFAKYASGWEGSNERRIGDYFAAPDYSEAYGPLFRSLVRNLGEFIRHEEGTQIYEKIRAKHDPTGENLRDIGSFESEEDSYEAAIRVLQVGEFALENGDVYRLIDRSLGRGGLRHLVRISGQYERQLEMVRNKHQLANKVKLDDLKNEIVDLVS